MVSIPESLGSDQPWAEFCSFVERHTKKSVLGLRGDIARREYLLVRMTDLLIPVDRVDFEVFNSGDNLPEAEESIGHAISLKVGDNAAYSLSYYGGEFSEALGEAGYGEHEVTQDHCVRAAKGLIRLLAEFENNGNLRALE